MERQLADRVQAMIRKHVPTDESAREAFVYNAWMGSPLLDLVDYSGTRYDFSTQLYMRGMLHRSLTNGDHALAALLTHIATLAGEDDRREIAVLLVELAQMENPTPATRQHDVFLSYAREDRAAMETIRGILTAHGITVWTDDNLAVGTPDWVSAIDANLRAAGAIVVLCSPSSDRSKWVREEWLMAQRLGLGVFPVLLAGDGFPFGLQSHQGIDGRKADLATVARQQLAPALAIFLGPGGAADARPSASPTPPESAPPAPALPPEPTKPPPTAEKPRTAPIVAERDPTNPTRPDTPRPRDKPKPQVGQGCVFTLVFVLVLLGGVSLAYGLMGGDFSPNISEPALAPTATDGPTSTHTRTPRPSATHTPRPSATHTPDRSATAAAGATRTLIALDPDLVYGDIIENRITSSNGDRWTFYGEAGDTVQIEMDGRGELDAYISLLDPDGDTLASNDDGGAGTDARLVRTLAHTGIYTITARGVGATTGDYTLWLQPPFYITGVTPDGDCESITYVVNVVDPDDRVVRIEIIERTDNRVLKFEVDGGSDAHRWPDFSCSYASCSDRYQLVAVDGTRSPIAESRITCDD